MSMPRSVSEKMGIKQGWKSIFIQANDEDLKEIGFPELQVAQILEGEFDFIHLFSKTQEDLNQQFPILKRHLKPTGMLWVSWPKAGLLTTDLNIKNVIKIGYDHGLVESKAISINSTWSALKFTHPKKGKIYNNSYGKLKEHP